ncbi:MAG: prepilin peptidase [Candidatus Omnitrophota bacterium]
MFEKVFIFIFGSVIGSFLNVCIHRMPVEGYSLARPSSHCPECKKPIFWYDNIPLLSYLFLTGKCRSCHKPISPRYFVVELLTALTFLFLYNRFGFSYNFFFCAIFLCALIVATFIDIKHRIIPDEISIGGMVIGLILRAAGGVNISPLQFDYRPLLNSLLGIIIGGGIIYLTGFIFDVVYFKLLKRPPIQGETESMGGGDVKLLAMIGAFLGWERALLTFFIAPFFGAVIGVINLAVKKDHTIPYGPFLSLAAVMSLFWAERIVRFVFSF